jgi:hypothetical protein
MDFTPDVEIRISGLAQDLFEHVLYDEKPLVVWGEATMWDVSMLAPADLLTRLSQYYQKPVSMNDLRVLLGRNQVVQQLLGIFNLMHSQTSFWD